MFFLSTRYHSSCSCFYAGKASLIINSKVNRVFSQPSSYSQQSICLTNQAKIGQNQALHETWQILQKILATFLFLFRRKRAKPTRFGYLWQLLFLRLIFSLSLFCSRAPVDRFRKNEDSSYVMYSSYVRVALIVEIFSHFFVSSFIGHRFPTDLKKFCWSYEILQNHFLCMNKQYFYQKIFLTKIQYEYT